jgi:hypothetical protein
MDHSIRRDSRQLERDTAVLLDASAVAPDRPGTMDVQMFITR